MYISDTDFIPFTKSNASKRQNKNLYFSVSFMHENLNLDNFIHKTHEFQISDVKTLHLFISDDPKLID